MNITILPTINHTIVDILKTAYWEAKRNYDSEQAALGHATHNRLYKEQQLTSAQGTEKAAAESCQKAADRLKDIKEFLRSAGIHGLSGTGEFE